MQRIRNGPLNIKSYNEIKNFHSKINDTNSVIEKHKKLFKKEWFTDWFWFRGGEIRLNPLDFTTDNFLAANPQYDQANVDKFNEYMDTVINRQIRYDSIGKTDDFIKKLKLKKTGEIIFSYKERNDLLLKENKSQRDQLLTTRQILNKVIIPSNMTFASFSALPEIKFQFEETILTRPIHTWEKKTIVLHNIPSGVARADLLETDKPIADKSGFQQDLDMVISQLGQLAVLVSQYAPIATGFNLAGLSPAPFNTIDYVEMEKPYSYISAGGVPNISPQTKPCSEFTLDLGAILIKYCDKSFKIKEKLIDALKENNAFENDIFQNHFSNLKDSTLEFLRTNKPKGVELREKYKQHLDSYLQDIFKEQGRLLQGDSVLLYGFLDIYQHSTLPETKPLDRNEPSGPVYYSKILTTKPSEDAIEKNVAIYTLSKDTLVIDKFKYKVGKSYRFSLGAGIGYTLNNYDQSIATQSNGSISVTNNTQLYQVILGMHVYLGKGLYMQDNGFFRHFWRERLAAFVGVGLPNPLENIYLGLSADAVPGLKINAGLHITRNNRYTIQNDRITEESLRYKIGGPYVGITIDPNSLLNLFNVFKKK